MIKIVGGRGQERVRPACREGQDQDAPPGLFGLTDHSADFEGYAPPHF